MDLYCLTDLTNSSSYHFEKHSLLTANFTFLAYTFFTIFSALLFINRQKKRLNKKATLTTTFNAGGSMSISLLSSTIVSQWTWAATLLQSTTVGTQFGLSGSYWYSAGACVQILLFSLVCMEMRIKAPGSRTFLQIIQVRFDKKTHILYCVFALLTNAIVSSMLLVGGIASIRYSFENVSAEYAILLFIISMSIYVIIGGLGAQFYVSYISTIVILLVTTIIFIKMFYSGQESENKIGDIDKIFERYLCIKNENNIDKSSKSFLSLDSFMFGIINLIGNFGAVFVDQSYWQLNATASPKKSSIAFIVAGVMWFFIPFCFGTTMSIGYNYLNSFSFNSTLLSAREIDSGLVVPIVAGISLGKVGNFLINLIVIFAVTTTGGGEILAVTNIFINDIYSVYLHPFKADSITKDRLICILCEKLRGKAGLDKCTCSSITNCKACEADERKLKANLNELRSCEMHGSYLNYEDHLNQIKNLTMVFVTLLMLIISIFLYNINLNLNWLYLFMGIIVGPAVVPITLSLFWARINSFSMFTSLLGGCIIGLISWITTTIIYYRGFDIEKSGKLISMLAGNVASISIGGLLVVILTLITSQPLNVDQCGEVWEKTRDIDSPLMPWTEIYAKEISIEQAHELKQRPSLLEVESELRLVKKVSWFLSISVSVFLVLVWPFLMINLGDFNYHAFKFWIIIGQIFIIISLIYSLFGPVLDHYLEIYIRKIKTRVLPKKHKVIKKMHK